MPGKGAGYWVGVLLDEPVGDCCGGKFKNKVYFEAAPKCGEFVRASDMQVGDFPERDIFDEEEDEI